MAKKKSKGPAAAIEPHRTEAQQYRPGSFPFSRYFSAVGVHTTLMMFTALFLPRTTFLFELTKPVVDFELRTSRDRPQHPFLEELTISPVSTLACLCAGVFLLQVWWVEWMSNPYGSSEQRKEEVDDRATADKDRFKHLGNACLSTLAASFAVFIILVLFGAPLNSHVAQTYLLALLLSLLIMFPSAHLLRLSLFAIYNGKSWAVNLIWVRLFGEFNPRTPLERAIVYPAIGTILGCWIGTIPIALDWDRPWQAWPLTPAYAGILGYIIASLTALTSSSIQHLADEHVRSLNSQHEKKHN